MVQILPQQTHLGSFLGQQIGSGLQQGLSQGLPQGFQRGMLQSALGKVKEIANPKPIGIDKSGQPIYPDVKPLDIMLQLMEAGAGIPGSEKYLSTLLPAILANTRAENLYGRGSGGEKAALTPAQAAREASKFVEGEEGQGFLRTPMTPDEQERYAENYALNLNDPHAYNEGLAQAQKINNERIQSRQALEAAAINQGIRPEELPRFIQSATKFQKLKDPKAIERAAINETLKIRNQKEALEKLEVPGFFSQLYTTALHPIQSLFDAFSGKPNKRQQYIDRYSNIIQSLVADGEEPFVREFLANKGLSPTEVEISIHPPTKQLLNELKSFPPSKVLKGEKRQNSLSNFFKNNLTDNSSLLVLREGLTKKGYSWEEIADAINSVFPSGEGLNRYQLAELPNISQPPIQSIANIFGSTPNIRGVLRGQL